MALINTIIMYIMMAFMLIGALDRILLQWASVDKFLAKIGLGKVREGISGTGEQFENGFMTMGALGLAMVGIIALAPVLATLLGPIVIPIYTFLGASPAMFATTILANDMGGFFLAKQLAFANGQMDNASWLFAGLILGGMMGSTLVFSIPVAVGIIDKKDRRFLALGVLAGMITIPIGCLAGGMIAMYSDIRINDVPVVFTYQMIFSNLSPVIIVALLVAIGLRMAPEMMINGFKIFAKVLVSLITIGLACAVINTILGITIIPGMDPIFMVPGDKVGEVMRAMDVIGYISCILLGAYPMVYLLTRWFAKPLTRVGNVLKINNVAAAGMLASLANSVPMFGMMKNMDERGKVINVAFAVSAAFTFGDHLGFTAANMPPMIFAVIVGKLVGGVSAVFVAMAIAPKKTNEEVQVG